MQSIPMRAAPAALVLMLAATQPGCPAGGTDAAPGTDATNPGTDAAPGLDSAFLEGDSGTTATIRAYVQEVQMNPAGPREGVTVEYFARADTAGTAPLASGVTDAAGNVFLQLDVSGGSVDDYVHLTEPTGLFVETFHYRNYPTTASKVRGVPIVSTSTWNLFEGLAAGYPGGYDDTIETIAAFSVEDCNGNTVADATFIASSGTVRYNIGGFPTGMNTTDASGEVVVFGVLAGVPATFSVTVPAAPPGCSGATTAMMMMDVRPGVPHLGIVALP